MTNLITKERFSQLLEAYGGHPKRWPAEERQAALQLLEKSEEAKKMHQHACQLDHLLDSIPPPPRGLKNPILASLPHPSWQQNFSFYKEYVLRPIIVSLLSLFLGIAIVFFMTSPFPGDEEEVYLLAFNEDLP